jgi:hypothetical protein
MSYELKAADDAFTMGSSAPNGKIWAAEFIPVGPRFIKLRDQRPKKGQIFD